jgi:protein-tyrosine phosphatase
MRRNRIRRPHTKDTVQRILAIEGTYNCRDLGGYETKDGLQTRWGVVLRSGSLHGLTSAGQAQLMAMGLRTVLDLRRPDEAAAESIALDRFIAYQNIPLVIDSPPSGGVYPPLTEVYRRIFDNRQAAFRAVLERLAAPDTFPALVHCTAGKDRTGMIAALLLGIAGVPDETIAADFAFSEAALRDDPGFAHHRERAIAAGRSAYLAAPAVLMTSSLQHLQTQYGGTTGYVHQIGLSEAQIERLRRALIGP